jgi:predicted porin
MMRKHKIGLAVVGALGLLAGSNAQALEVVKGDWSLNIDGQVNAFYTDTNCKPGGGPTTPVVTGGSFVALGATCAASGDNVNIQNGLLPAYLKFTAATKQKGLDIKAVVGFWPGTTTTQAANTLQDNRTIYLSFGSSNWGEIKLGRDIGLFQQNAILNDMTLLGVGTGAGFQGSINTTLGMIGSGYIYTEFQPQITYTTPNKGGLQGSIGVFQPRTTAGVGGATKNTDKPGWQGLLSYDWKGGTTGKVWGSFATQQADTAVVGGQTLKGHGYELGGKIGVGGLNLMLVGYSGKGLGDAIQFVNGHDAAGTQRKSNGYLAQATYGFGDFQLGLSHGQSKVDATSIDPAANLNKREASVLQGKYSLTPNLSLIAEWVTQKEKNHAGQADKADTIAAGAILFF